MNRWSIVIGVTLHSMLGGAYASKVNSGGGSETGFLGCAVDSECGTGQSCVEAKCAKQGAQTALVTVTEPAGTCDDPQEFSTSMPSWWQAEWTPSLPSTPRPGCGFPSVPQGAAAPAIIGKWTAPSDGQYWAEAYSRDMQAVFAGGASECGVSLGCSLLEAQNVPDPPFDSTVIGGGGFNLGVKAGDVLFFSFQFLAEDGGAPPDHGRVIATVRPY